MSKPWVVQNMALFLQRNRISCFILIKVVNSKSFLNVINTVQIKIAPGTSTDNWKNLTYSMIVVFLWHCFRQTKQHNLQLAQKIIGRVAKKWVLLVGIQMIDKLFSGSSYIMFAKMWVWFNVIFIVTEIKIIWFRVQVEKMLSHHLTSVCQAKQESKFCYIFVC